MTHQTNAIGAVKKTERPTNPLRHHRSCIEIPWDLILERSPGRKVFGPGTRDHGSVRLGGATAPRPMKANAAAKGSGVSPSGSAVRRTIENSRSGQRKAPSSGEGVRRFRLSPGTGRVSGG